jgi:cysteine desulfurase/selenocysteine lyase
MSIQALAPRSDFPLLEREIEGKRVVYLDSAATSLKPRRVIDEVSWFYTEGTANIHRGVHTLSRNASERFENAREDVARFIGATAREVVFTSNCTESINLVAAALKLGAGDKVIVSVIDHHSNILPWMSRCEVAFLPEAKDGVTDVARLESMIDDRTRLIALGHVSNVTGGINDVAKAVSIAKKRNIPVLIDGAQSVAHFPVDVRALGIDFLAFSAHKMLGPSGIGALYIAEEMWDRMGSLKLGGGTVDYVRTDGFNLKRIPHRFEAGTPNIEGVLGFAAAVRYLDDLGMEKVKAHDEELGQLLMDRFQRIKNLRILGPTDPKKKIAILPFLPDSPLIDFEQLGMMLSDSFKVMARTGTHCCHPYFDSHRLIGCVRFSTHVYTSEEDVLFAADRTEELVKKLLG